MPSTAASFNKTLWPVLGVLAVLASVSAGAEIPPPTELLIEPLPPIIEPPEEQEALPPVVRDGEAPLTTGPDALPFTPGTIEDTTAPSRRRGASIVFCAETSECGGGAACVGGSCVSLRDPTVRLLFPIAVDRVPDRVTGRRAGPIPDRTDDLLRRFLSLSGFFRVIPATENPPAASFEGLSLNAIDHEAWFYSGAYAVVKGEITRDKEGIILTLRLVLVEDARMISLPHDRQILPDEQPATVKLAVTRWVDDLVTLLSGKRGVFSTRVAFAKRTHKVGPKEIGVMDMDGDAESMLTQNGSINLLPGWNRRGKVTWTSFKDTNPDLYVGGVKFSSRPRLNSGAAFSPDGKTVALTLSKDGQAEIYLLDGQTGDIIRNVTRHKAIDTSPTWSPDMTKIAFVTDRFSGYPLLAVTDPEGTSVELLPQIGGYNSSPDWSPTGDEIAYSAMVGGETYQIFAINVVTRRVRRLTSVGSNEEPSYSPDGRYIVYSGTRGGQTGLWIMTADGENDRLISRGTGSYLAPAWER